MEIKKNKITAILGIDTDLNIDEEKLELDFLKSIKDISNISFVNDKKGSEYWLDDGMYEVIYKKGNSIRFKKVLSY